MNFKLIKFDELLNDLKHNQPLEENLSKIIRDIEMEFDFQSMGVYLKSARSQKFRLKISRNISYTFSKNKVFERSDMLLQKLANFKTLDIKEPNEIRFEKDYSHLIIAPIYFKKDLMGFIFLDKKDSFFSENEIAKLRMFASIISLVVKIFVQQNDIEQLTDVDELTGVYSRRTFIGRAEYMLSQVKRYDRDLTMVILKIDNFQKMIRTIGKAKMDNILVEIAENMRNDLRQTDIIGRIETDTFIILMPESLPEKVLKAVERLNFHIHQLENIEKCQFGWGIAGKKEKIKTIEEFIHITMQAASDAVRNSDNKILVA